MSTVESHKVNFLGQIASSASFTAVVDGSTDSVAITVPTSGLMSNGDKKSLFANGDGIQILSIGYKMPLSFEWYRTSDNTDFFTIIEIGFLTKNTAKYTKIDEIYHPFESTEICYGVFYKQSAFLGDDYYLHARFSKIPHVSMLGANSRLNTKTFQIPIFIKIEHTLDLVE